MFLITYGAENSYHIWVIEEEVWDELKWMLVADVGKLLNEYDKLELSMVMCFSLGGVVARKKRQRGYFKPW
ncbi:hypothetical protein Tco_1411381, partial [Tanacetum coccineum]